MCVARSWRINGEFGGVVGRFWPNKVLQKTKTAVANFRILLPHNVLVACQAWLPAVRQRFWLLSTGVRRRKRLIVAFYFSITYKKFFADKLPYLTHYEILGYEKY